MDPIHTKIAGVCSGDRDTRQAALEELADLRNANPDQKVYLDLVPHPENPYDPDAIAIFVNLPDLGRVQLGFIQNANTRCTFCDYRHERFPKNGCVRCGRTDSLEREGLATRIAAEWRGDPEANFFAELLEVTGGTDSKNFGANILVRKAFKRKQSQVVDLAKPGTFGPRKR